MFSRERLRSHPPRSTRDSTTPKCLSTMTHRCNCSCPRVKCHHHSHTKEHHSCVGRPVLAKRVPSTVTVQQALSTTRFWRAHPFCRSSSSLCTHWTPKRLVWLCIKQLYSVSNPEHKIGLKEHETMPTFRKGNFFQSPGFWSRRKGRFAWRLQWPQGRLYIGLCTF